MTPRTRQRLITPGDCQRRDGFVCTILHRTLNVGCISNAPSVSARSVSVSGVCNKASYANPMGFGIVDRIDDRRRGTVIRRSGPDNH